MRRLLNHLCEKARLRVLAVTLERAKTDGPIQRLIHAVWLADVDGVRGHRLLLDAIKGLPASPFLRFAMAAHFMSRVYWNQWDMSDRKRLLDAAELTLKPMMNLKKGEIIRYIEAQLSEPPHS